MGHNKYDRSTIQKNNKVKITSINVTSDSMSDRSAVSEKAIMGRASGVNKSPLKRFTDSHVWLDFLASSYFNDKWNKVLDELNTLKVEAEKIEPNPKKNRFLRQYTGLINLIKKEAREARLDLNHHRKIKIGGERVAQTHTEGGTTSAKWTGFGSDIETTGARAMVSNLDAKRKQILKFDEKYNTSAQQKKETLMVEWTGANDLITVNKISYKASKIAFRAADKSIEARIKHAEEMINHGYKNYVLMNLPDLSKTPRFALEGNESETSSKYKNNKLAEKVSNYYNQELEKAVEALKNKYEGKGVKIVLYDINTKYLKMLKNENGQFSNTTDSYKDSDIKRSRKQRGGASKEGYFFDDDVHPTSTVHRELAKNFKEDMEEHFIVDLGSKPEKNAKELYNQFQEVFYKTYQSNNRSKSSGEPSVMSSLTAAKRKIRENKPGDEPLSNDDYTKLVSVIMQNAIANKKSLASKVVKRLEWLTSEIHPDLVKARAMVSKKTKTPNVSLNFAKKNIVKMKETLSQFRATGKENVPEEDIKEQRNNAQRKGP